MTNSIDIQDKIDSYLLNKINEAEKAAFEELLSSDDELKQKVEIQRLVVEELKNRATFNRIINSGVNKREKKHIDFRLGMIIIWSAAAIFLGVFLINRTIINDRMDSLYTEMYTIPQGNMYRGETDQQENEFIAAVTLLDDDRPEQAKTAFLKLYAFSENYPYHESVRWYLALTELKLHNKTKAIEYLYELMDSETYVDNVLLILDRL